MAVSQEWVDLVAFKINHRIAARQLAGSVKCALGGVRPRQRDEEVRKAIGRGEGNKVVTYSRTVRAVLSAVEQSLVLVARGAGG